MRLSRTRWAARTGAVLLVLAGALAAVAVVVAGHSTAHLEAESSTRAAAADAVPLVAATLRGAVEDAEAAAAFPQQPIPFAEAEERGVPVETAVRARDTARALLDESGVVVVATYDAPMPPSSVAARRQAFSGLHVVPLQLGSTLVRLRPPEGGIVVAGPEAVVSQRPGPPPPEATTYTVELSSTLASGWTVTVWTPNIGPPLSTWALGLLLLLAGVGAAGLLLRRDERAVLVEHELAQLREQSSTLTAMAAVAQRSLDLAEVLPAMATELTESLGLRGLSLTAPSPEGERPFFASGEGTGVDAARGLPDSVDTGEALSLPLSRGGRTVARLNVVAGRPLGTLEVGTLAAVAEILASALANAEAFSQQRELLQRMRAVDELKTVFLATASHELRTPVGAITGFARLLSSKVDVLTPEQVRTYADRVESNAQQLGALVENLLDFSRLERGAGLDGDHAVLDLGSTVSRILDQQPDLAADHVVTHYTASGVQVRGTVHAVERVLTNLVGNAGKYSPAGTTIRVQVRVHQGRAEMIVDDEGPGVAAEDREQIFSRFFRGRGDVVVNTRGAGLGLAIVREFAATMDGVVSVDVAPSGGARFMVTYPLAKAEQQPAEGDTDVAS